MSGPLDTLRRTSDALDIPMIASLNGTTSAGWIECSRELEQAGPAIELNMYSIPLYLFKIGRRLVTRAVPDVVKDAIGRKEPHARHDG